MTFLRERQLVPVNLVNAGSAQPNSSGHKIPFDFYEQVKDEEEN